MKWTKLVRETGLIEHVCEHGVGHPDEASAHLVAERLGHPHSTWTTHGCEGCCSRDDFPGRTEEKKDTK